MHKHCAGRLSSCRVEWCIGNQWHVQILGQSQEERLPKIIVSKGRLMLNHKGPISQRRIDGGVQTLEAQHFKFAKSCEWKPN